MSQKTGRRSVGSVGFLDIARNIACATHFEMPPCYSICITRRAAMLGEIPLQRCLRTVVPTNEAETASAVAQGLAGRISMPGLEIALASGRDQESQSSDNGALEQMDEEVRVDEDREIDGGHTSVWLFDHRIAYAALAHGIADHGIASSTQRSETASSDTTGSQTTSSVGQPAAGAMLQWVELMRCGQVDALHRLYASTEKSVRKLANRITRDSTLADEVTAATFFQAWMQAARFNPARGSVQTWLLCIARSRAIDALRSVDGARSHTEPLALAELETEQQASPEDQAIEAERAMQLHRALLDLEALHRQLLALAYFKGATHEEIAGQLRLPLGTVKSHIKRALVSLRRGLAGLDADMPQRCLQPKYRLRVAAAGSAKQPF